jgi:hypothetical protein
MDVFPEFVDVLQATIPPPRRGVNRESGVPRSRKQAVLF